MILMPDGGGVAKALTSRLAKLGVEVLEIDGAPDAEALEASIAAWTAAGPIQGVYWLPALDDEGPLGGLEPAERSEALRVRVKLLAVAMRALAAPDTFLVSATRLGGRHGYGAEGATSVLGGAVTGFTKALARERPDVLVKAVDFAPSRKTAALADLLVDETLHDPGAVEVGHADDLRWTVSLAEEAAGHDPAHEPSADTVFVVTGAAGSIVSAITADLAASGGTFHLLDLVAEPDPGDPDLARYASDRDALKGELAERLRETRRAPDAQARRARVGAHRARPCGTRRHRRDPAAGGTARWHQVDLTDAEAVARAVEQVLADSGRVDVLVHAAGVEISHFLPDKPQREYDLVFDVKAAGWLNLLHAMREAPPRSAVAFSSIAGRFGNAGQTDYAAANDLLCKSASNLRRTAGMRASVIDWTAWAGIGMASRGSIPKMMQAAGIDMLPPEIGVPVVRRELTADGTGGEVVVAGALGVLLAERHPTGGLDAERATAAAAALGGPMTGRIAALTVGGGLSVITELDPGRQAFLDDHRIEGTPVLPGVMGMEGFAEAAHALLPGWDGRGARGRRPAGAVQVLPRRAAHARAPRAGARRRRRHARGRLPADRAADAARPGRAGDVSLHGARAPGAGGARRRHRRSPLRPTARRRRPRQRLPRLLPRARLPGARPRLARQRPRDRPAGGRPARRPRAAGQPDRVRPAPDRAVLPDRQCIRARRMSSREVRPLVLVHPFHQLAAQRLFGVHLESCCLECRFNGTFVHAFWDQAKQAHTTMPLLSAHPSGRDGRIHQHVSLQLKHARALCECLWEGRDMHQHIARPEEVKPLVLKGKRFDVSLHKGHPVAHAFLCGSGLSLLDVELSDVQAHDEHRRLATADIEDARGSADSTCRGDLVDHAVWAWV